MLIKYYRQRKWKKKCCKFLLLDILVLLVNMIGPSAKGNPGTVQTPEIIRMYQADNTTNMIVEFQLYCYSKYCRPFPLIAEGIDTLLSQNVPELESQPFSEQMYRVFYWEI